MALKAAFFDAVRSRLADGSLIFEVRPSRFALFRTRPVLGMIDNASTRSQNGL